MADIAYTLLPLGDSITISFAFTFLNIFSTVVFIVGTYWNIYY